MSLTRREAIGAAAAVLASLTASAGTDAPNRKRPNILWLVSEDNNPLLGAYGDKLAHTPNIDALARDGVVFLNAFSTAPVCAPSRFAILTGCYAESLAPANHMRADAHLPPELRTYPEYLRAAGYYCTNNPKTDYNCDVDPAHIWNESSAKAHWRNRPQGAPFMAVFNTMTTHEGKLFQPTAGRVTPEQVRIPAYLPDTPEVRRDFASYYNLMEKMDGEIGARQKELADAGLTDDTIVFYYSDNGGALPRTKHYAYDQGFRCSLIIKAPPRWRHLLPASAGGEVKEPVSFIDLAPTVLALADVRKPAQMQGSTLLGNDTLRGRRWVFGMRDRMDERYDMIRTVADGRYRYIRNYMPHRPWGVNLGYCWMMASFQSWEREFRAGRLNAAQARFFQEKTFEEFYDLQSDPDQVVNLIEDPQHRARIGQFRQALDRHMVTINDNGFIPEGGAAEGYERSRDRNLYPLKKAMSLASAAARRDPRKLQLFRARLSDSNEVIRYWAAQGLLMLGPAAAAARTELETTLRADPSTAVQIVAAEAVVKLGNPAPAVQRLADILGSKLPLTARLQAINALTFIGEAARGALPQIRAAAEEDEIYMRTTGRYLAAVLDGTYEPGYPSFDYSWFQRKMGLTK
ncbi:sulfatase-like hydrolase/transferase [Steroidobacter flavus]|uniref:Sulfatase-like hydrolase/transferase n=1 Tax=Steroidobacter flavus TaxID=1842136 RepID=A0ABV8SXM1_9GAMM